MMIIWNMSLVDIMSPITIFENAAFARRAILFVVQKGSAEIWARHFYQLLSAHFVISKALRGCTGDFWRFHKI
jgi:hypothetical protein